MEGGFCGTEIEVEGEEWCGVDYLAVGDATGLEFERGEFE